MDVGLYIPCFNAAETIKSCLEAVLKQSCLPKEIVIVDDASTDATADIVSRYPVRLIKQKHNKGLAAARNAAIKEMNTEFIASVDADCLVDPQWLKQLMEEFKSPEIGGSGGRLLETQASCVFDLWRSIHMKQYWEGDGTEPLFLYGSNTVFRKRALVETGFYNEEFKNNYEDVDICRRIKIKGYVIKYQPKAIANHLKKDSLYSLLNSFWKWNLEFYRQKSYYSNQDNFIFKLNDNLGLANRYLEDDLHSKRHHLLYLDFLLGLHHCMRDFEFYVSQSNQEREGKHGLSSWLSLLDLTFFYHFDSGGNTLRTAMAGENKIIQNFFALNLVFGKLIQEKFKNEKFQKILCKHLLFSVYRINDQHLLNKILDLTLLHKNWDDLYGKKHPHLDAVFLEKLVFNLHRWLDQPIFGAHDLIKLIEFSAEQTDESAYL